MRGSDGCDSLCNFHALCSEQNREPMCILGKHKRVSFPWSRLLQFRHNWPGIRNTELNMIKSSHCNCTNRKRNFWKEVLGSFYNTGERKLEDNFFQGCLEKSGASVPQRQLLKAGYPLKITGTLSAFEKSFTSTESSTSITTLELNTMYACI